MTEYTRVETNYWRTLRQITYQWLGVADSAGYHLDKQLIFLWLTGSNVLHFQASGVECCMADDCPSFPGHL